MCCKMLYTKTRQYNWHLRYFKLCIPIRYLTCSLCIKNSYRPNIRRHKPPLLTHPPRKLTHYNNNKRNFGAQCQKMVNFHFNIRIIRKIIRKLRRRLMIKDQNPLKWNDTWASLDLYWTFYYFSYIINGSLWYEKIF